MVEGKCCGELHHGRSVLHWAANGIGKCAQSAELRPRAWLGPRMCLGSRLMARRGYSFRIRPIFRFRPLVISLHVAAGSTRRWINPR
jgi:hypothetical protein